MALLFMEGFEADGGNANALARKYDAIANATGTATGRLHGTAFAVAAASRLRTRTLTSPTAIAIIGFGYQDGNVGSSAEDLEFRILAGAADQLKLRIVTVTTSTFKVDVMRGATVLGSSAAYSTLNWHYFELKATIHQTTGDWELRHNNSVDVSDAGPVNTADSGAANWDTIDINNTASDANMRLDDIYVLDGSGTDNIDFRGDSVIEGRLPTGDTVTIDWTPSSGIDHWDLLDDTNDATFVSSSVATDVDLLTFDSLSFITGTIYGVMAMMQVGLDVTGTRTVRHKCLSGATTGNGASQVVGTTGFTSLYEIWEQDPNTAAAWTLANLNAADFGYELVS